MSNNNDRAHVTIVLPNSCAVTAYMAYRPAEGPDGSDWDARYDLTNPDGFGDGETVRYGWKWGHAVAFVSEHSPAAEADTCIDRLASASRYLMMAQSYSV